MASSSEDEDEEISYLDKLPQELFIIVCSYIDARYLIRVVRIVCRQFYVIICDQKVWKRRFKHRLPTVQFPDFVVSDENFLWSRTSVLTEREVDRWSYSRKNQMSLAGPDFMLSGGHFASVDAVHLIGPQSKFCLSGSRDRAMCLWDLDAVGPTENPGCTITDADVINPSLINMQEQAHKGWIWSITSVNDDIIYSAGWDGYVNHWQLRPDTVEILSSMKLGAAVLSVIAEPGLIIASTFDKKVTLFDPRDCNKEIEILKYHTGPVLSLAAADDSSPYIYSSAEDKFVHRVDKRTWKPVNSRQLPRYAQSLSFAERQLWICTGGGYISLLNPYMDGLPSVGTFKVADSNRICQVKHSLGSVACISNDKHLRVYAGGKKLKSLYVSDQFDAEPHRIDYNNGRMVCGFSDGNIGLWKHTC